MYKLMDDSGKVVKKDSTFYSEGGSGWQEYLDWCAAGNSPEPWKTDVELLNDAVEAKRAEVKAERNRRVDLAAGTTDHRRKTKMISRMVKILRKESKGNATAEEKAELDAAESMDDLVESIYSASDAADQYLLGGRTIAEVEVYDAVNDPGWPA